VLAEVVLAAPLILSSTLPGELADEATAGRLPSSNGANAPADSPEHADSLPALAARLDLALRGEESAVTGQEAELSGAAALPGSARGTPGMSQPGSVIVASLRQDRSLISTAHTFDNTGSYSYFRPIIYRTGKLGQVRGPYLLRWHCPWLGWLRPRGDRVGS
jgi:hypothetical protein